jgi:plasmid stabilization system protein ParE
MNILWSPEAVKDLTSLRAYIAADNPAAAQKLVLHIMHEQLLADDPRLGRLAAFRHARAYHPQHAVYRPLSTAEKRHTDTTNLSRIAPVAR